MKEQTPDTEGFLGRWARLKQESRQPLNDTHLIDPPESAGLPEPASSDTGTPEETTDTTPVSPAPTHEPVILTDKDMPPIDTLDEHSDYQGFMSSGVSEELRRLALRKLFSAPQFNVRDGLDDYDEDYTYFAKLDPGVITSDMKHRIEVEARRALEALDKLSQPATTSTQNEALPEAFVETTQETAPAPHCLENDATESATSATATADSPATDISTASPPLPDQPDTEEPSA